MNDLMIKPITTQRNRLIYTYKGCNHKMEEVKMKTDFNCKLFNPYTTAALKVLVLSVPAIMHDIQ